MNSSQIPVQINPTQLAQRFISQIEEGSAHIAAGRRDEGSNIYTLAYTLYLIHPFPLDENLKMLLAQNIPAAAINPDTISVNVLTFFESIIPTLQSIKLNLSAEEKQLRSIISPVMFINTLVLLKHVANQLLIRRQFDKAFIFYDLGHQLMMQLVETPDKYVMFIDNCRTFAYALDVHINTPFTNRITNLFLADGLYNYIAKELLQPDDIRHQQKIKRNIIELVMSKALDTSLAMTDRHAYLVQALGMNQISNPTPQEQIGFCKLFKTYCMTLDILDPNTKLELLNKLLSEYYKVPETESIPIRADLFETQRLAINFFNYHGTRNLEAGSFETSSNYFMLAMNTCDLIRKPFKEGFDHAEHYYACRQFVKAKFAILRSSENKFSDIQLETLKNLIEKNKTPVVVVTEDQRRGYCFHQREFANNLFTFSQELIQKTEQHTAAIYFLQTSISLLENLADQKDDILPAVKQYLEHFQSTLQRSPFLAFTSPHVSQSIFPVQRPNLYINTDPEPTPEEVITRMQGMQLQ